MQKVVTLSEFILDRQSDFPYATGELTRLLADMGIAAKIVNQQVNKAGLGNILGAHGSENVQGEEQQKLDVFADEVFMHALKAGGQVCGIASEEQEDFVAFDSSICRDGKYVVLFDPLDGSSNIDVNVSIGTIFSIFRRTSTPGTPADASDFLQPGKDQVAAGYVLYGSSTMLVYTTGKGVNGFTLEPTIGEFCLSHPGMQIPKDGHIYSVNEGNWEVMSEGVRQYVKVCRERELRGRYIGSLVADFHRNLIKGGIYIYPGITSAPKGKLRLLYECSPLAMIAEEAGGEATDGQQRVLDINPDELHQRLPFFVGSSDMVEEAMEMVRQHDKVEI